MNSLSTSTEPLVAHRMKSQIVIGLVLTLFMGVVLAWLTIRPPSPQMPVWMRIVVGIGALLAFWATYVCAKQWRDPPMMLEATNQGIITFQKCNVYDKDPNGVLVPWSDIEKIETQTLSVPTGDGDSQFRCVVLHLRAGHDLPLEKISLGTPNAMSVKLGKVAPDTHQNTLFLDGDTDFGSFESLAKELERRRQKFLP